MFIDFFTSVWNEETLSRNAMDPSKCGLEPAAFR